MITKKKLSFFMAIHKILLLLDLAKLQCCVERYIHSAFYAHKLARKKERL